MLNQVNNPKVLESVSKLGNPATITSDNRTIVRTLLNGLGFETKAYINATVSELGQIYSGLLACDPAPLSKIGATHEESLEAVTRFSAACGGTVKEAAPTPAQNVPVIPPSNSGVSQSEAEKALQILLGALGNKTPGGLTESQVITLIKEHAPKPRPTEIVIKTDSESRAVPTGVFHESLPMLIKAAATGDNIMLVGPAGSGKTTLAHQCAQALDVPFFFNGAIASEYKLTGFIDAQGRIVSTAFRKAYETGGLYLFDEIDASMPDALLAFNAALSNGHTDFPDGSISRHEKFYCIAAANTFGKGADRVYVGRNQLDAASLDRFTVMNIDYDEKLEKAIVGNDNWVDRVQRIRKAVFDLKIRHVVSPRASMKGAKLLAAGFTENQVLDMVVWKGLDKDSVQKIKAQS